MLTLIRKYWYVLLAAAAVISFGVNVYLLSDSRKLDDLNHQLEQTNGYLDARIKEAGEKENAYIEEIKEKKKIIEDMDIELSDAVQRYEQLKTEMATLRKPEDPRYFKDLEECKGKYALLSNDLKLSLDFGKETELSLTLCTQRSKAQQDVILLTENAYNECRKQGELKDLKIENMREALTDLDRFYKRKQFKRGLFKYAVGAVAGIAAGYFIFKKR